MTIFYLKKDITTVEAPAIIAHGVNCQGVMGSGVAKAIYTKWPEVRSEYMKLPQDQRKLGGIQVVFLGEGSSRRMIINCFTQESYGKDGKVYADKQAIRSCVIYLGFLAKVAGMNEIFMPKIGCGLGGLSWEKDVEPIIKEVSDEHGINYNVCEV